MNELEKGLGRELLNALEEKELTELSRTVTKGKFDAADKREAVELILQYEVDVKTLLSRKKISTNLLTQYLHYKGVDFSIDAHKHSLADTVLKYWDSVTRSSHQELNSALQDSNDLVASGRLTRDALCVQHYNNATFMSGDGSAVQHYHSAADVTSVQQYSPSDTGAVMLCESDVRILGRQFIDWFYSQLRGPDLVLRSVGAEHFFTDASCKIVNGSHVQEGVGREGCASALESALKAAGHAVPVPNLSGVRSQASLHGAVRVLVCGTLHAPPVRMLGAFEQAFLLARDPTTPDNWKIKYTELRLNCADSSPPELEQTSPVPSIQYNRC